jgi:PBP1b-binding outer membrane lipoprotein LpoB
MRYIILLAIVAFVFVGCQSETPTTPPADGTGEVTPAPADPEAPPADDAAVEPVAAEAADEAAE